MPRRYLHIVWPLATAVVLLSLWFSATRSTPRADPRLPEDDAEPRSRPNILWIVWDTVRADRLSVYGYSKETTPNLAAWAEDARVFEDCRSAAGYTLASHASMFTGLLPREHGTHNGHHQLDECHDTVAELLQSAGYQTYLYSANPNVRERNGFSRGFERVEHPWDPALAGAAFEIVAAKVPEGDSTSALAERVQSARGGEAKLQLWDLKATGALQERRLLKWLESTDPQRPFFAFLNYMEAHRPYIPPRRFRRKMMSKSRTEASYELKRPLTYIWEYCFGLREFSKEELAVMSGTYDATLAELDELFAHLMRALDEAGHLDDTVVIVTSDHGEHLGEHHMLAHQFTLYDELIHVPLIVRAPGSLAPGREHRPVMSMDLYPTLLELAGVDPPAQLNSQSVSLLRPAEERVRIAQEPAYFKHALTVIGGMHPEFDPRPWTRRLTSVVKGTTKFTWTSDSRCELYDLGSDPDELVDLAPGSLARVREMTAQVEALHRHMSPRCARGGAPPAIPMTTLERELLHGLGYVGSDEDEHETATNDEPDPAAEDAQPPPGAAGRAEAPVPVSTEGNERA